MFELIVYLALLPLAIAGLLLILGILVLTWRFLIAAVLFLLSLVIILAIPALEPVIKLVILYIIAAVIYGLVIDNDEKNSIEMQHEIKDTRPTVAFKIEDKNEKEVITYIQSKGRFTYFQIKKLMNEKANTMNVINSLVKDGYVKPEGIKAPMHWIVIKEIK